MRLKHSFEPIRNKSELYQRQTLSEMMNQTKFLSIYSKVETCRRHCKLIATDNKFSFCYFETDGQLKVAVNGIEALHTRIEFADDLKFFSFASREDRQREEFFYDCV